MNDQAFAADAHRELLENILPFWRKNAIDQHGGFIGEMSNDLHVRQDAPKGLILNARILWTFSAAFRYANNPEDEAVARRAYSYLTHYFSDPMHGGYMWSLTPEGEPLDKSKKIYGQAFCIYALAEFDQAFDEPGAKHYATDVFHLIEKHAHDKTHGGYVETLAADWKPCADVRLSDKDMNEKKSMNNHLHILEAYTNLLRICPDHKLELRLKELIDLFRKHIINKQGTHFNHFFAEDWTPKSDSYTFGHDIEGSWLIYEAAEVLAKCSSSNQRLLESTKTIAINMARAVLNEGLDQDGSLFYEARNGEIINAGKEWWPQAEAVVGFLNTWQLTKESTFRDAAERCWKFIQSNVVDHQNGEWFWRILPNGTPDPSEPKISAWKCPYHNARCCLDVIRRIENMQSRSSE